MWHDHPSTQRNKITKRAVGVEVGGDEKGVVGKILKNMKKLQNISLCLIGSKK